MYNRYHFLKLFRQYRRSPSNIGTFGYITYFNLWNILPK